MMQIPDSFVTTLENRLRRLIEAVPQNPSDHRTADLLRLARKDLHKLGTYVSKTKKEKTQMPSSDVLFRREMVSGNH
ncbi:hypothetical protein EEL52_06255 [Muribaculaceae bacterium Isolate-113 (HZI)]|nr:hypothetical protein EEL53_13255 [Muribaculaceae bacterium Isolate-114 (HZI)]ROT22717.1 hypothetical protein EEL52_06255 [Muribaculaceae bacterium Isolate-113 (HZI)]